VGITGGDLILWIRLPNFGQKPWNYSPLPEQGKQETNQIDEDVIIGGGKASV
jgi:hypothetical protein